MLWKTFGLGACLVGIAGGAAASDLDYRFAAQSLESAKQAEHVILSLPAELQNAAILATAGKLNLTLQKWGKQEIDNGELSPQELFAVMASTLRSLAVLTQEANWPDATACHVREAALLDDMATGKPVKPANCRSGVYGSLQASALKLGPKLEAPKIASALKKWVDSTILTGFYAVRAGRKE